MSNLSEREIDMNIFMVAAGLFSILVYGSLLVVSIKKKRNFLWIMVSIFFIALGMVLVLAGWHANEYETAIEVQNTPADSIEITYANLARNPEDYEEKRLLLSGEVIQVIEGATETSLRIAVGSNSDSIVLVHYDSSITKNRILIGDYVKIDAVSEGLHTYSSALAGDITIPMLFVSMIEIQ